MQFLPAEQYQPAALRVYAELARRIAGPVLGGRIEHVGSSSIPGVRSKGDLDIFVGVDSARFTEAILALERLGFRIKQDSLRNEFLCPFEGFGQPMDVGVQLVVNGSPFDFFCTFRNRLIADQGLREEYDAMKAASAGLSPGEYRTVKSAFIGKVLAASPPPGASALTAADTPAGPPTI